ncbi:hypothetical protein W97_09265 [Coniosporium apollinis CBS 100218]|uniref:UspA domain-containing protein n=1 Tax=Coniosporium apollinis (strain CBS 100218) TaxID=1168221 RepID=R7Z7J5_CONA1|nr:uncharacterized protein W97_09265 [Coniosporium apollinis CBS 100218]EON69999.1 hypothetical protein W97_09265 [Coniosporium apollinis CBS 100218]
MLPTPPKPSRKGKERAESVFRPRVSFDTFDRPADFIEENSFTLREKHKDYEYTKRSRTFLCGLDSNDYSEYALEWLIDELVDDGDEVVCLRVVESDAGIEKGRYRTEAEELMEYIQTKNSDNKAINLVLEFAVGKVNKVIDDMINLYEPAILIVGTRGRSLKGFQGLLPGSVSKYCLQHSPVPVIVVRPNAKRAKHKRQRLEDPERQGYRNLLAKSGPQGGHILDRSNRDSLLLDNPKPISQAESDAEAAAVAAAIGYKPAPSSHPLSQMHGAPQIRVETDLARTPTSPESTYSPLSAGDLSSPEILRSPGPVYKDLESSQTLEPLDSPAPSVDSSDDEDERPGRPGTIREHGQPELTLLPKTNASEEEDSSPKSASVPQDEVAMAENSKPRTWLDYSSR